MDFNWQSALEGAAIWWMVSAILSSVPAAKETDPWAIRWFSAAAHTIAANIDKLKNKDVK